MGVAMESHSPTIKGERIALEMSSCQDYLETFNVELGLEES